MVLAVLVFWGGGCWRYSFGFFYSMEIWLTPSQIESLSIVPAPLLSLRGFGSQSIAWGVNIRPEANHLRPVQH